MDQNFDGIAEKFHRNIYGSYKGKLRHAILTYRLAEKLANSPKLNILDLGGGTGVVTKECLAWGHSVDIVDPSSDVLDIARKELADTEHVRFHQSKLQDYQIDKQYDVVMCHAVLEWLSEPLDQLEMILRHLKPDGLLSLSVFNKDATLFGNMAYGNFEYVQKGMKVKNQVRLNPQNPISPKHLLEALDERGVTVAEMTGIRCFLDYVKRPLDDDDFETLLALEKQYCQQAPYLWLGKYFHVFASWKIAD